VSKPATRKGVNNENVKKKVKLDLDQSIQLAKEKLRRLEEEW
jgi:hypothetical protein